MPVDASAASPDDPRDGQPGPLRGLVLVSTPIGNLGDISARARAGSRNKRPDPVRGYPPDRRACSRRWISTPEPTRFTTTTRTARSRWCSVSFGPGRRSRLVSDAGTPLVSDPGYRLVRAAIAARSAGERCSRPQCRGDSADFVRPAAIAFLVSWLSAPAGRRSPGGLQRVAGGGAGWACHRRSSGMRRRIACLRRWAMRRRSSEIVQPPSRAN